jgi:hypothetical protein
MQDRKLPLSKNEIIYMIEDMASTGIAPVDGCSLFGVGNDEFINIIKEVYLEKRFNRGASDEKFVIGPFGSGKTHFVNQLSEIARLMGCVTSTVSLTKNVNVLSDYDIYWQIVQNIRSPNTPGSGIENLLITCLERFKNVAKEQTKEQTNPKEAANSLLKNWIDGLETDSEFKYDMFGRVAKLALDALQKDDKEMFHAAAHWISGDFQNKEYSKMLNVQRFTQSERNLLATRVSLSLYQLIKKSGFLGTVIVFDEAEQGFSISTKKKGILYSLLLSQINSIVALKGGSVLLLYAIHPSIKEDMMNNDALKSRVEHLFPFSRDAPFAPCIEIDPSNSSREDILKELIAIGNKLTDLLYESTERPITIQKQETYESIKTLAERTIDQDSSRSSRRMMVKHTCTILANLHNNDKLLDPKQMNLSVPVPAIDEEV